MPLDRLPMLKNFRNIAVVSLSTGGSRVLGLLRDVMLFAALGASMWSSAFLLAFTLPNLFRRLLGEGAMTSAMIPVFSEVLEHAGKRAAFSFFSQVFFRLTLFLLGIVLFGGGVLWSMLQLDWVGPRWEIGAELSIYLLPYMLFICLSAIVAAGLNVLGRFGAAACTPMLLNVAIICSLGIGMWLGDSEIEMVYWLCGGVLLGGLLQLLVPAVDLMRQGWQPYPTVARSEYLVELMRLLLPALAGAAIMQLNIMISRLLAHSLDDSAVSVLYLASRLMELPLGLFTVAVMTVFFPLMSKALVGKDEGGFVSSLMSAMRLVVAISVPAAVGLLILGEPIVELLRFGEFKGADALVAAYLVGIYGLGLPFYSVATVLTRGLHAGKAMRITVRIAALSLVVNVVASLIFMRVWGVAGLASANVLAVVVQVLFLWRALMRDHPGVELRAFKQAFVQVGLAATMMGVVCQLGLWCLAAVDFSSVKLEAIITVGGLVPLAIVLYGVLLHWFQFEELSVLKRLIGRLRQ